ncbi:hypothetical protein TRICI_002178 [Trichomonascus ciferrii]|uniref:Rab-GAP TBC domain-containing protein n=1 Tax=Trichomonascus ciferrii TaxID=44093 RepID=A0A642V6H2_9ASCO|nr:hypothetical protein TRICI_002178 [Trichomonascus ciferrii]
MSAKVFESYTTTTTTTTTTKEMEETFRGGENDDEQNQGKKSLAALSSTLSASSSLSGSTTYSPTMSSSRFKHYLKPTVSDSPELVSLCQQYIEDKDVEGLARLARNRGLPPDLRQYAWPLLLENHPYVLEPNIIPEFPTQPVSDEIIPVRRVRNDISRYRRRLKPMIRYNNNFQISSNQSARSTPLSTSPSSPTSATANGTVTPKRVGEVDDTAALSEYLSESLEDQRFNVIQEAIETFLGKWGKLIPYESGITWVAFALADWVNPVYEMKKSSTSNASTPEMTPVSEWEPGFSFSTVFEHFMLVMFHSPKPKGDGPYGPCDSPITDRISSFLSVFRKMLPEISAHFDEEDVLSNIGGDEWLIWWIKWLGAKVWNLNDRARVWDMYLGWRPDGAKQESTYEAEIGIGTDPFWNVMELESTKILEPHLQHLFVCIALLKANKHTLLELDQSEIREFLGRVSKSKDTESIIQEAGESYRSWKWLEEHEEEED